jgi:hypothetical protein
MTTQLHIVAGRLAADAREVPSSEGSYVELLLPITHQMRSESPPVWYRVRYEKYKDTLNKLKQGDYLIITGSYLSPQLSHIDGEQRIILDLAASWIDLDATHQGPSQTRDQGGHARVPPPAPSSRSGAG